MAEADAVEALRSGVPIKTSQVRAELAEGFPEASDGGLSPDQIRAVLGLRVPVKLHPDGSKAAR